MPMSARSPSKDADAGVGSGDYSHLQAPNDLMLSHKSLPDPARPEAFGLDARSGVQNERRLNRSLDRCGDTSTLPRVRSMPSTKAPKDTRRREGRGRKSMENMDDVPTSPDRANMPDGHMDPGSPGQVLSPSMNMPLSPGQNMPTSPETISGNMHPTALLHSAVASYVGPSLGTAMGCEILTPPAEPHESEKESRRGQGDLANMPARTLKEPFPGHAPKRKKSKERNSGPEDRPASVASIMSAADSTDGREHTPEELAQQRPQSVLSVCDSVATEVESWNGEVEIRFAGDRPGTVEEGIEVRPGTCDSVESWQLRDARPGSVESVPDMSDLRPDTAESWDGTPTWPPKGVGVHLPAIGGLPPGCRKNYKKVRIGGLDDEIEAGVSYFGIGGDLSPDRRPSNDIPVTQEQLDLSGARPPARAGRQQVFPGSPGLEDSLDDNMI